MPFRVCSRDEEEVLRCWRREASGAGRLWVSENWILNQQTAPSTASIGFSVNAGAGRCAGATSLARNATISYLLIHELSLLQSMIPMPSPCFC